jgi:hypothetical protein
MPAFETFLPQQLPIILSYYPDLAVLELRSTGSPARASFLLVPFMLLVVVQLASLKINSFLVAVLLMMSDYFLLLAVVLLADYLEILTWALSN